MLRKKKFQAQIPLSMLHLLDSTTMDDAVASSLKTIEVTASRASKMELQDLPSLKRRGNFEKISLREENLC